MFALITLIASSVMALGPETPLEAAILDEAQHCQNVQSQMWPDGEVPREYLRALLSVEAQFDIPLEMRGMLLAMACHESGYNPDALGDFRGRGRRRNPMAVGLYQQWPWFEKHKRAGGYGIKRRDPIQASVAQMQLWVHQTKKAERLCRIARESEEAKWAIAQVRAARGPVETCRSGRGGKDCNRCKQRSKHYDLFVKWRKNWMKVLSVEQVASND